MQSLTACSWASHPEKTVPAPLHVGCTGPVQRRKAIKAPPHAGTIEERFAQWVAHVGSVVVPGQLARVNLSHHEAHESATWAAEQLFVHEATPPPSPASTITAEPPHATNPARAGNMRRKPPPKLIMKSLPPVLLRSSPRVA
jgi:hypothetical protein